MPRSCRKGMGLRTWTTSDDCSVQGCRTPGHAAVCPGAERGRIGECEPESESAARQTCAACGSANRKGNSFCASCGVPLSRHGGTEAEPANPKSAPEAPGDHHYHHHYHHHYFSNAGAESRLRLLTCAGRRRRWLRDLARVRAALSGASLSRAETASAKYPGLGAGVQHRTAGRSGGALPFRRYRASADVPAVRGTAAIREFFFGLLDAGMSEVELDPLRVELFGDLVRGCRWNLLVPAPRANGARTR